MKANSKAIQAIGNHVITHNTRYELYCLITDIFINIIINIIIRVSVSHDENRRKWRLHIAAAQLEDAGPYMCQLNTDPMRSRMGVLDVIIKPDIVDVTGPRAVVEGGNIR